MITSSTFSLGPTQADGRQYVSEIHTTADGTSYPYEYLADGKLDPQMVMEERAIVINATLRAREAARLAVVGTDVLLTKHQFLSRFTPDERISIRMAARTDEHVLDFMEMLNAADGVAMALARPGLQYLVVIGKLTPARATEIGMS